MGCRPGRDGSHRARHDEPRAEDVRHELRPGAQALTPRGDAVGPRCSDREWRRAMAARVEDQMSEQLTRRETLRMGLAAASLAALVPEWAYPALAQGESD